MRIYGAAIIGAGAAGLAAAACGGEAWALLERNEEPGKKLYATGNGRCNYMNVNADKATGSTGTLALKEKLRSLGIYGRVEAEGRLYPMSGRAEDVVAALLARVRAKKTELITGFEVVSAVKENGLFMIASADGRKLCAKKLIVATGGKAGIQYGCYGTGYKLAEAFGHSIIKPIPALVPLECKEELGSIAGVRVKGKISLVKRRAPDEAREADSAESEIKRHSDSGEILFSKTGISGICTMNISRFLRLEPGSEFWAELDLFEDFSEDGLSALLRERAGALRESAACEENAAFILNSLLPSKLAIFVLKRAGIEAERKISALRPEDFDRIARHCKALRFEISGSAGWRQAQVSCGGVELSEIDTDSMESRLVSGLYFAGEVLDYDGPCGGYNLSWAFSTGIRAGEAAEKSLSSPSVFPAP